MAAHRIQIKDTKPYRLGPFNGLGFLLACFQSLLFVIQKEKKEY